MATGCSACSGPAPQDLSKSADSGQRMNRARKRHTMLSSDQRQGRELDYTNDQTFVFASTDSRAAAHTLASRPASARHFLSFAIAQNTRLTAMATCAQGGAPSPEAERPSAEGGALGGQRRGRHRPVTAGAALTTQHINLLRGFEGGE